ncbi:phosphopantetheine-binding protein [Streptomyces sp. NPDC091287]|uniref:phosphopantetheine-binding protein n=1 Tax=Streptomyces sp. NPDC091287 TaxID=3365988 RepID=UPI0038274D44
MTSTQADTATVATELDKEELRGVIARVLDVDVADVTDDASFTADLGVDSLLALEVVVVLEQTYGLPFKEQELQRVTSLSSAYEVLTEKAQAR